MPGILYHLSFSKEVYRQLNSVCPINEINFMAGNLIPDLATDKQKSHYRKPASVNGFFVPEMSLVKQDLYVPTDPIKLGMYCHLYLDYYFIEEFLLPEFIWDTKSMKVINPRNNKEWSLDTFFSHSGMYGSYTEINGLMLQDGHISLEKVNQIPEILPSTGIAVFDQRIPTTWKAELAEYLAQKKEYTGEIFDYHRLWSSIEKIATRFTKEVLK